MHGLKGLGDFCRKHKIQIPKGDSFNLLEFLLQVSGKAIQLAEYKGSVTEVISRLGEESDEWGGCPRCGSNVHLGLSDCPVCGLDLSAEESESEDVEEQEDDLSELDSDYVDDEEPTENFDDLDELDDDDEEEVDDEEVEEEDEDPLDETFEEEDSEETEEESEDDLDEFEEEEDPEDEEIEDDETEEEVEDEFEDEEEPEEEDDAEEEVDIDDEVEDDEELEPLSTAKASVKQKKLLKKNPPEKVDPRRNLMPASQKAKLREQRRKKLESLIPKFQKKPSLIDRLKYRDLLIMPGLLGYKKRPSMIGKKEEIQEWVKKNLKRKGARA